MSKGLLRRELEDYIVQHDARMYRLAYSYCRNKEDALDVVQESIVKALAHCGQLKDPEHMQTWVYRIVVNTALTVLRKNKRAVPSETMPEEAVTDRYADADLYAMLDGLEEKSRTVVVLRFFEDMPLQQIAQVLDENLSTVKSKLYAALRKLKMECKEEAL